jgi:hypothetical protein
MDSRLQTYVVEDNLTIRENLIGTLEELTCTTVVGFAETEDHARAWLLGARQRMGPGHRRPFPQAGKRPGRAAGLPGRVDRPEGGGAQQLRDPDIRRRCAELGVDAVFDKSNEIDALVDFCVAGLALRAPGS